jgi:hypothetical protein
VSNTTAVEAMISKTVETYGRSGYPLKAGQCGVGHVP